jgi:hypothetical protein
MGGSKAKTCYAMQFDEWATPGRAGEHPAQASHAYRKAVGRRE